MSNLNFIEQIATYVAKYAPKYNICVHSPIIAQAILESASGTSELAQENVNNFFGLNWRENRCPTSNGYYIKVGSEQNADGSYTSSVMKWFRFPDMEAGVQGYFDFINNANYSKLKGVTEPRKYLEYIKDAGYATSLKYVDNLMNVIQKYELTKYDPKKSENAEVIAMKKVFLSAGHGGSDPGAVANGLKEKDINLQTMLACKEVLEKNNIIVICSRIADEYDPVQEEVKEANNSGCDLAVSFHVNGGGGDGFEAFCNLKNTDAVNLAKLAEKHIKTLGQNSRGIKDGMRLYFIKNTKNTSVLFESFFLDNVEDKKIGDTIE
ncbi:MAG: N-acetylmuramoyl-L-alanine amidase, partial [Alphaproteobacteria bacterium]|nr:N-acetylmuramoyl-L-alanine amidase [Alphaproteobacteria bacterium]